MKQLNYLSTPFFVLLTSFTLAAEQPNIILLLSDDQHWNETSVQMHPSITSSKSKLYLTPHLEKMATEGMRFSSAYAPAPVCSPTRISIQTGMSPAALRWTKAGKSATAKHNLPLIPPTNETEFGELPTFAQFLQRAGYQTAHYGKWHLGVDPKTKGYDESDGNIGNEASSQFKDPNPTDIFGMTERATTFMEKQKAAQQPFYLQMSYLALHSPANASKKNLDKVSTANPKLAKRIAQRAALTADLDEGVGLLLSKLTKLGLEQNTYVIYMSDNGASGRSNSTLSGSKGSIREGGIRVAFIAKGPNIPPNSWCHERVVGFDFFPTFCKLAGITEQLPSEIEGGDISHLLSGRQAPVKRKFDSLVFHFPHYQAATPESALYHGNYKLIRTYETGKESLYNITTDLAERKNLSAQHPELVQQLGEKLTAQLTCLNATLPTKNTSFDPNKESISLGKKGRRGRNGRVRDQHRGTNRAGSKRDQPRNLEQ